MKTVNLMHGDCLSLLKELPSASVDSCVTDPPYELGFMGKSWDATGIANDPALWAEVLRVLKPGGHLVAFSGTRTYHNMAVAIERAGFEIRDMLQWLYGTGFPKSHDVSKGIDKMLGAEREIIGKSTNGIAGGTGELVSGNTKTAGFKAEFNITKPKTGAAIEWQGFGTALKPACEPICLARKPLSEKTIAANVLAHGAGALNIDGCRIGDTVKTWPKSRSYAPGQFQPGGVGKTQSTGSVPSGRWPANIIHDSSEEIVEMFPQENNQSPSRFFYCAKASRADRGEGNNHPTVKPTKLMRWLCRLITPPGGIILDPFLGSGSTGKAAKIEGFSFIGMDLQEEYIQIAQKRIDAAVLGEEP